MPSLISPTTTPCQPGRAWAQCPLPRPPPPLDGKTGSSVLAAWRGGRSALGVGILGAVAFHSSELWVNMASIETPWAQVFAERRAKGFTSVLAFEYNSTLLCDWSLTVAKGSALPRLQPNRRFEGVLVTSVCQHQLVTTVTTTTTMTYVTTRAA